MSEEIALGFGNNVDYEIVWDAQVLEDLIIRYQVRADESDSRGTIRSERDLLISILGFMSVSGGGERFVANSDLIERFADRFDKKVTLGGTTVRAAIAMRVLGYRSALHLVTLNDQVRRLIPHDSPYVCSNPGDHSYPHLIVQFPKDACLNAGDIDIRATQPNRLIYHCNADNIAMRLNEDFAEMMAGAKVLLVSGFNAMQSKPLLEERLDTLLRMMERLPDHATVFCEDGGYFDSGFRQLIQGRLGPRIDVYSMNEDELQTQLKRRVGLRDVEQARAALTDLHRLIPAATLVVHTQYWALAHGEAASKYAAALQAGVTMATTRFRYGDDFTAENYSEIEARAPSEVNAKFAQCVNAQLGDNLFCVAVPDVDQSNATTIGLGDAFVGGFLPKLLM